VDLDDELADAGGGEGRGVVAAVDGVQGGCGGGQGQQQDED
jgi:hypothetical protein